MSTFVFESVVEVMSGLLGINPDSITMESSMETVDQWDSLQHLNLIIDIEQRFNIQLQPEEVMELHSVAAIVAIVQAKIG